MMSGVKRPGSIILGTGMKVTSHEAATSVRGAEFEIGADSPIHLHIPP